MGLKQTGGVGFWKAVKADLFLPSPLTPMVKIPADFKESESRSVLNTSENPTCKACRVHYRGKILYKAQQGHTEIVSILLMAFTVDVCIEFNWAASQ